MGIFPILLIFIVVFAANYKKNKKTEAAKARLHPTQLHAPVTPRSVPLSHEGAVFHDPEPAAKPALHKQMNGESYTDEEGCVGGSLPHTEHGGLSFSDDEGCVGGSLPHAEHEGGEAVRRSENWQESKVYGGRKTNVTADDMRRAVILGEILNRPIALRGKREMNA